MRELHVVALSEDGTYVHLATTPGAVRGGFRVRLDERLAAAVRGDLPRPGETVVRESALPVKEIQARLRAGETPAQVARAAGVPVARVERWAGPVESEKQQVVLAARNAVLVRGRRGPSAVPLGEAVDRHLEELPSLKEDSVSWTARRGDEPRWTVEVSWYSRGKTRTAAWTYDPHSRELVAADSGAAALGHVDTDPAARPARAGAVADGAAEAGPRVPAPAGRRAPTAAAFPRTAQSRDKAARGAGGRRGVASGTLTRAGGATATGTDTGGAAAPAARSTTAGRTVTARGTASTRAAAAAAPASGRAPAKGAAKAPAKAPAKAAAKAAATTPAKTPAKAPAKAAVKAAAKAPAKAPARARPKAAPEAPATTASRTPAAARSGAAARRPAGSAAAEAPPAAPPPAGPPALRVVAGEAAAPSSARRGRAAVPSWDEVLLSTGSSEDSRT